MRYIEDFKENERILEHYLCKKKQSLKSKSGKNYFSLTLYDKTGEINAKVWELNNDIQSFEENDFIKVDGQVISYQGNLQLKLVKIRKSSEGEYLPENYIPATSKNIDDLYNELLSYIDSIDEKYIKKLLEYIFVEDEYIKNEIKVRSAAKSMHHSYLGGLIEHTVSVVSLCDYLSTKYKFVDRSILLAGAMLHDVGKIYELSPFPENDYTDDGQLLGHLIIGIEIVNKKCDLIEGFPNQLKSLIKHNILAHHGELEYGSPKIPSTIESFLVHMADTLDSKVQMFEEHFEKNKNFSTWSGYNKMLGRKLRKSKYSE